MNISRTAPRLLVIILLAVACGAMSVSCGGENKHVAVNRLAVDKQQFLTQNKLVGGARDRSLSYESGESSDDPLMKAVERKYTGERKEIVTGELTLEVKTVEETARRISKIVESAGGYVSASNYSAEEESSSKSCTMTVRAPAGKFGVALGEIKALGKVKLDSMKRDDVTEEYIDTAARLKNMQAQEQRYQEIMKKANTVEEILKVEEQLGTVRGEIESLAGRQKYLDNQVGFSTLSITLTEKYIPTTKKWRITDSFSTAWAAFKDTLKQIAETLAWLTVYSPLIIAAALILWLLGRIRKRRKTSNG